MAKAIGDEELQLKKRARRRLVGAIALVLLVVVFLPMFLDSEPKPLNQDIAITIPPLPGADSRSQPATAASAAVAPSGTDMPHAKTEIAPPLRPAPAPVVVPKAEAPKPETRPAPVQQAKTSETSEDFVVQLGAFSSAANARALQRKLQENKFKAYTEVMRSSGAERTRVRVGPYNSREAAEKARQRMRALKLVIGDATVVRQGE
ncbi:MAG TPA: SPOR domain-containing protein [Burkholderiales bacterium]|nr:SPOR domain-containing protein [Burkholderiales bacterium]